MIELVVYVAILVGAWRLWRWSRARAKAARTVWRRRVGLLFLFAPLLLIVGRALSLPDLVLLPLEAIGVLAKGIDWALAALTGAAKDNLPGPIAWAVRPLAYAVVYGGLGWLIGWALDRRAEKKAAAEAGQSPGGGPPSSPPGSSPA